jgi:histidine kinase 2/3/4 (cytokinin receptor)
LSEDIESVEKDNVEPSDRTAAAGAAASGSASSMTLSGYSVANRRSSWDRFEVLLAHESSKASIPNEAQSSEVRLFVSVEDTGIGIPPEAQKRIFRPFMQVDSSTSRTHGGTGIGLSISNCLVNLMGGQMGFDSIENVGSTFTFTLALRSGHPALLSSIDEQGGSVCLIDAGLPTKLKGMRALVVDGRPLQSQVAKQHLQRLGIRVQTVTDSDVAANLIRDRRKSLRW